MGGTERHLITREYFDEGLQKTYNSIVSPVFGVQAVLDANPIYGLI